MEVKSEDSSPSVELSQQTIDKFEELSKVEDALEEQEALSVQVKEEPVRNVRASDEGLNEDGTVKLEEEKSEPEGTKPSTESAEVEEAGEVEDEKPAEIRSGEEKEMSLPNRLIQAGYRSGLNDEDIVALGDRAEPVLSKMADNADKISAELGERGRLSKETPMKPVEPTEPDVLKLDETEPEFEGDKRFGQIGKNLNALLGRVANIEKQNKQREEEYITTTIDTYLDDKVKDYPEFGESKNLTIAQKAIRVDIVHNADNIFLGAEQAGRPVSIQNALDMAFSIYEGKNAKTTVRAKLIKDAKQRSKEITARPSRRKTEKHYSSDKEKAMDSYRKALAAHGIPIPADQEED